ncbi:MAG TPA: hypothetical protein PKK00_09505 [Bacteroidales bacterium]|nr:hypothetical protein [Bacteroidales bacterium]HPS15858.1 hypothetical protein [Bacteroidales bacterium]
MKYFPVLFIIIVFSVFSCSSKHHHGADSLDTVLVKGKVTDVIKCRYDVTQSYALYLPSNYDKNKKWPVVYMFDPHAKGAYPLTKYSAIAEKFGYILIGSNNSQNGVQFNVIKNFFDTLYSDSHRKFSIDDNFIYAAGFSGGSRVASNLAVYGKIKSVIACGAGMSGNEVNSANFGYYGIAGNEDFNQNEMFALKEILPQKSIPYCFDTFDGKHEWPPDSIMEQAFLWLKLQAVKNKLIIADTTEINPVFKKWEKEFIELKSKNICKAYQLCEKMISFFDGIKDVSAYKKSLEELKKNPSYIAAIQKQKTISEKEIKLQSDYAVAIGEKDTLWWKKQVTLINQQIKTNADKDERVMYKRLLNYLSLVAYMNTNNAMKMNDYETAYRYVIIYSLVDPENTDCAYFKTVILMKKGKIPEALLSLENAARLGFSDAGKLESDTIMDRLRTQEKYSKIIEEIKMNSTKEK